jgi:glycosyltransferase involved in cell wall biosynthesis/GT2 family glycosyltransferase
MFEELPSFSGFQPKSYSGGPVRFHLPFLYDLVAAAKPKIAVVLGFGDGDAFFTLCEATSDTGETGQCIAVRRERPEEPEAEDVRWRDGVGDGEEVYGEGAKFFSTTEAALSGVADGSVEFLLIDDSDSGPAIAAELKAWQPKLASQAVVLLHGVGIERDEGPTEAWSAWVGKRAQVTFSAGLGLSVARHGKATPSPSLFKLLFGRTAKPDELAGVYRLVSERIDAVVRASEAQRKSAAFEIRQVWLDSVLTDRWKAQEVMDHQARLVAHQERLVADRERELEERAHQVADLEGRLHLVVAQHEELKLQFQNLHRDRAKAQLVMDSQAEQVKKWAAQADLVSAELAKTQQQLKHHKELLKVAKAACRNKGRCFQIHTGPKIERSFGEKIMRELQRLPRNLRILPDRETPPPAPIKTTDEPGPTPPQDRYERWIAEHEPDAAGLEEQRRLAKDLVDAPKISLLTPVYNTPPAFLDEMFESVIAQTYDRWELCVVDGGSDSPRTIEALRRWGTRDKRIRIERLEENLGISRNTNRALRMATGEFVAFLDHDDLLAPSALFEVARAAMEAPGTDIFYSDEDRLSPEGKRHNPFFKPEWSPELLCSFMYTGHLSAYRRSLAIDIGFRREFDLSQDYDFALRATEWAKSVGHIPKVLYHWREHPASGSTGGKPEARQTNLAALADAMRRRNLAADILEYPTANRARLKISKWPRVSIVIPTDSPTRAQACLQELPRATKYPSLEIVLVTNSQLAESLKLLEAENATVRLVPYDKPFNFSDKCNVGAAAATGERVIFFNDDVETDQADWIQTVIEPLENPKVGAVAPKLLYETGKIQHAGLVTGVRGLIGTAFHQRPADSTEHVNFAQSLRNVSALSAACLAMRRDDFKRIGGFDAVNTPIAHSDVDLCFKVREAGLRCVYTPFATMRHTGHVSIGATEKQSRRRKADKGTTFLLKRWGRYVTHDPFFPDNMREWLHSDSPTPIRMHAVQRSAPTEAGPDLLFVSHDLTLSGAPILLMQLATWCQRNGMFVTVIAPTDGPLREKYEAAKIPLIIDPLCETGHESFGKFAHDFDCVLANTVRTEGAVRAAHKAKVPVIWWVHETQVGEHYLREEAKLRSALPLADVILAPTERTASVYRPFTEALVQCSPYGIPDIRREGDMDESTGPKKVLRFLLLGSIEPRKGQDIFLEAISLLPAWVEKVATFRLLGRVMDPDFGARVSSAASGLPHVSVDAETDHRAALDAIRECDVLVCSSRDEALPVTILEALSLGKAIVTARVGGIGEVLTDAQDALIVKPDDPKALASAIQRVIDNPEAARRLGEAGRATFEKNFTQDRFGADFRRLVAEVMVRDGTYDPYSRQKSGADLPASPGRAAAGEPSLRLLFVSHDLSLSGAPMMLFHAATWCQRNGILVTVVAPENGPLGEKMKGQGIPVIIDPLIESGDESFFRFARDFDCIIANTIRSGAVVRALKGQNVPIVWWVHEPSSVGEHYLREDATLRAPLPLADLFLTPSESTATVYRRYTDQPVKCLRNAIPDPGPVAEKRSADAARPLRFLFLGSIEPRKGQDVFVAALASLPTELQEAAQFQIAGRVLDPDFWPKVEAVARTLPNLSVKGAVNHAEAMGLMRDADVVVCASRDEAMPTVTILEAMSLGKALIATVVGGAEEVLVDGENALLVEPDAPETLASAIRRLVENPALANELGERGRQTYETDFAMERFGKEFRQLIAGVTSKRVAVERARDA